MLSQVLCVAFDAVGTLIYPHPPVAEIYARVGRKYGSRLSEEEISTRFREAFREVYSGDWLTTPTDEILERALWKEIVLRVFHFRDLKKTEACFEELFEHFAQAEAWRCYPDVDEPLRRLAERGLQLVLASNFDRRVHAICEGHAELAPLQTRIISSEVGFHKPAAGFYRALAKQAGAAPREILMVGDDWENDIIGAMEFGLKVVYLDRSPQASEKPFRIAKTIPSLMELLDLLP